MMEPATLLAIGSTLLRGAGRLFGGKTERVTENAAVMVDQVKDLPHQLAEAKLARMMAELPVEDLLELKKVEAKAAEIDKEREANRLAAQTARHTQTETTHRTEIQSEDPYVRHTRPGLARKSAYTAFAYLIATGVLFPLINAFANTSLPGPNEWIALSMFSPCLTYMGLRTWDAFSPRGKTGDSTKASPMGMPFFMSGDYVQASPPYQFGARHS